MPLVKIELKAGRDTESLIQIRDCVMDCVVDTLNLPDNDRNVRLVEHQAGFFHMKPPYEILIEISMFSGRTRGTKKKLYRDIVNSLDTSKLVEKERVFVLINEQPMENWGVRGGIPADEIDLGIDVKI